MIKFKKTHKKSMNRIYFIQLLLFVISMFFVGSGAFAEETSQQTPETYKITLPQKVEGVEKLEYVIDNKNMGSTSGKETIDVNSGSVINFLVQVEPESYSQLKAKDLKISSDKGKNLSLARYMYNATGGITKVALAENDVLDVKQTYVTTDYTVNSNAIFSIKNDLKKDAFNATIALDSKEYSANEALDVSYVFGKDDQQKTPLYNEKDNSLELQNITAGTPITLKINAKEDFSNSKIEVFCGENQIIPFSDGSMTLPAIRSDLSILVKNIHKNECSLSFGNYEGISFEYKKQGTEDDFKSTTTEPLKIMSGESYDFKCTAKSEDLLSNKEVTANGTYIEKENDVYSLLNIKEDTKIEVTPKEETCYNINLPESGRGITITDESGTAINSGKAKFGDSFKFKVKAEEGYERNISDALIYAVPKNELENNDYDTTKNPEQSDKYLLTPSQDDIYSISNIKNSVSLIVKNLKKDSYKVKLPETLSGASYKVESSEGVMEVSKNVFSVIRDSKLLITLTADEEKSLENVTLGCNNSDIKVSRSGDTFTVENITDDSDIIINNIENKKCRVTFDNEGVMCEDEKGSVFGKSTMTLNYKGSQKFKVGLKDGYKTDSEITLNLKSGKAKLAKLPEENSYEISDVTEHTVLSVAGVEKEQLKVSFRSLDSFAEFISADNKPLKNSAMVAYGDNLEFNVTSSTDKEQIYSVASSDGKAEIETLDSSANRFLLKNVSSNVIISAVPVSATTNHPDVILNTENTSFSKNTTKNNTKNLENTTHESSLVTSDAENDGQRGGNLTLNTDATSFSWPVCVTRGGQNYQFYENGDQNVGNLSEFTNKGYRIERSSSENGELQDLNGNSDSADTTFNGGPFNGGNLGSWRGARHIKYKITSPADKKITKVNLFEDYGGDNRVPIEENSGDRRDIYSIGGHYAYVTLSYDVDEININYINDNTATIDIEFDITINNYWFIDNNLDLGINNIDLFEKIGMDFELEDTSYKPPSGAQLEIPTGLTGIANDHSYTTQAYYFYSSDTSGSLRQNKKYDVFCKTGNSSEYEPFGDDQIAKDKDKYGVSYTKTGDNKWEGEYDISFKFMPNSNNINEPIDDADLYEKTPFNNNTFMKNKTNYAITGGMDGFKNVAIRYSILEDENGNKIGYQKEDVEDDQGKVIGKIIHLKIKVSIEDIGNLLVNSEVAYINLSHHIDMKATNPKSYTNKTAAIHTKLTADGEKFYYYPPKSNGYAEKLSREQYQFFFNLNPYYYKPSDYVEITDGQSRINDSIGGNNVTYKQTNQGTWEGTYGARFKANSKDASKLIKNIKLYTVSPQTENNHIDIGKSWNGSSSWGSNVKFEILRCDSTHSTQSPGSEELLLQIKITITAGDSLADITSIQLFDHIDVILDIADKIDYNIDMFEDILNFKSNGETASWLRFQCDNTGNDESNGNSEVSVKPSYSSTGTENTMNMISGGKNQSNIKLTSKPGVNGGYATGEFYMKFRVEPRSVGSTVGKNMSIIPKLTYYNSQTGELVTEDENENEPTIKAGGVYEIVTASTTDYWWDQPCVARPVTVYNRVVLHIDESYMEQPNDNQTYGEYIISGSCKLIDYSCGSTDSGSEKIGNVFKGQNEDSENNGFSSVEYTIGKDSVEADVSFEESHMVTFKKVNKEETSGETAEEDITGPIHVVKGGELSFVVYANKGYKFEAKNAKEALNCIKVNNAKISQNDYYVEVEENGYSESDQTYVRYKISGISIDTKKLTISVNPFMIDLITVTGTFEGKNSEYKTSDGTIFDQHSFKYDEDNFEFIVNPSEEAQENQAPTCAITIGNMRYNYTVPTVIGESGAEFSTSANELLMRSTRTTRGIEITLAKVRADFKITFDYDRKEVPINFNTDGRFKYLITSPYTLTEQGEIFNNDQRSIKYGQNLSFSIGANDNSVDISNITVTANGIPIYMVNGKYTIKSITAEQNIEVQNVKTITNEITFTKYDNIFFRDMSSNNYPEKVNVEYNQEIQFRVSTSEAYSESEGNLTVMAEMASGTILTFGDPKCESAVYDKDNNYYTLKNVKENARIYIKDVAPNKYTITFKDIEGIEYYNQYGTAKLNSYTQEVSHGDNFSFKVMAKEGYDLSNLEVYDQKGSSENPSQILPAKDVYTISNISDDHTITAQNAATSKCKIEFRTLDGAVYVDSSGNVINGSVEVDYGKDYKFKVSLEKAYNKSTPKVTIKGTSKPLSKGSDGTYTISGVKEDKIVELTNVTKNSYTATFKDAEGVIYKTAKNKPFKGTQQVEYDSNLYFKLSLMDAYDKSSPWVLLNGDKTLVENGGVYSLENIRDDVVVTVKNVYKNPEEIGISDISNIPENVSSESDIDNVVKATKTYMSLSDEEKEQVTNIDDLKKAQENAGRLNHSSNDVEVSGIDWNIKLIVTPLTDDAEKMKSFEEKVDRRSLFSLYEIHLLDLLTGENYEVPYGQEVSVILPAPDLTGCTNEVVAHETSSGSMEYLDLNIVDDRAQFQTSSFSMFGIAAKKIQNYVENPSDMKISVNSLVDNEDELKSLLGDGLVSQLGKLIDEDSAAGKNNGDNNDANKNGDDSSTDDTLNADSTEGDNLGLKKLLGGTNLEDAYNWMMDNELAAVIVILLIGSLLIWLLLALARKKKKDEEEKTKASK